MKFEEVSSLIFSLYILHTVIVLVLTSAQFLYTKKIIFAFFFQSELTKETTWFHAVGFVKTIWILGETRSLIFKLGGGYQVFSSQKAQVQEKSQVISVNVQVELQDFFIFLFFYFFSKVDLQIIKFVTGVWHEYKWCDLSTNPWWTVLNNSPQNRWC